MAQITIDIVYEEDGTTYKPRWSALQDPTDDLIAGTASLIAEVLKGSGNQNQAIGVGFVSDVLNTARDFMVRADKEEDI